MAWGRTTSNDLYKKRNVTILPVSSLSKGKKCRRKIRQDIRRHSPVLEVIFTIIVTIVGYTYP